MLALQPISLAAVSTTASSSSSASASLFSASAPSPRQRLEGQLKTTLSEVKHISEKGLTWAIAYNPWDLAAQIEELDEDDVGALKHGKDAACDEADEKEAARRAEEKEDVCAGMGAGKRQRMTPPGARANAQANTQASAHANSNVQVRTPTGCGQEIAARGGCMGDGDGHVVCMGGGLGGGLGGDRIVR